MHYWQRLSLDSVIFTVKILSILLFLYFLKWPHQISDPPLL